MNPNCPDSEAPALTRLLREACSEETLPPRFTEGVWRRIRRADVETAAAPSWLVRLVNLLLQPRWALAGLMALMVLGAILGASRGRQAADELARARYLASVAPVVAR